MSFGVGNVSFSKGISGSKTTGMVSTSSRIYVSKSSKGKSNAKKIKLQYNYKLLSGMVLRAKTSVGAGQAVVKAKQKVAELQRKLKSDQCDENQVKHALLHAKQMERIAKKRKRNLLQEEQIQYKNSENMKYTTQPEESIEEFYSEEALREMMEEFADDMEELMKEMEELAKELQEEMLPEDELLTAGSDMDSSDLKELKRKHRSDEWKDIVRADMKYLKALFNQLEQEKNNSSSGVPGISLELGGMEQPIPDLATVPAAEISSVDVTL